MQRASTNINFTGENDVKTNKELTIQTIKTSDIDSAYKGLLEGLVYAPDFVSTSRKGDTIHEQLFTTIELTNLNNCLPFSRNLSLPYLFGELAFYLKGQNLLKNVAPYSTFWNKVSDDGVHLNSCYGYYIYKMKTRSGVSQLDYVVNQLLTNKDSKKAVITIYNGGKHSYKTKDNPCTMYLQYLIRGDKLYSITNMRSNDIWYGMPYDVPFFVFLQKQLYYVLKETYKSLSMGTYVHRANSLHLYARNINEAKNIISKPYAGVHLNAITKQTVKNAHVLTKRKLGTGVPTGLKDKFLLQGIKMMDNKFYMNAAYASARHSTCLKKQVGAVYVKSDGKILSHGWSGRPEKMGACKICVRKTEEFFQDGCNSVHSEYRGFLNAMRVGTPMEHFKGTTVYITHAPCDQCMKLLLELGVSKIVYDVEYKIDFSRYKGLIKVEDMNGKIII